MNLSEISGRNMKLASKVMWLIFGSFTFILVIFLVTGVYDPFFFPYDTYLLLMLLLSTITGILAPFLLKVRSYKIIAWCIFAGASIASIFWFIITEFSYVLFFTLCNLSFIFMYSLFFIMIPFYAIKYQGKFEQSSVRGYHIHENTYGILLILLGFLSYYLAFEWHISIDPLDFLKTHILIFFTVFTIILGGFLIGRDYQDVLQLVFIEKNATRKLDPEFNKREGFYRTSPFGLVFILVGIIFLLNKWFWIGIFPLDKPFFAVIGFVLIIFGAIVGGLNPTYFAKKADIN